MGTHGIKPIARCFLREYTSAMKDTINFAPLRPFRAAGVVLGTLLLLAMYHHAVSPTLTIFLQRAGPQSAMEEIVLPHEGAGDKLPQKNATYTLLVDQGISGVRSLMIRPDDCVRKVEVNNGIVPLPPGDLCLRSSPIRVFVKPYLNSGSNQITIAIENTGGPYGMRLHLTPSIAVIVGYIIIIALGAIVAYRHAGLTGETLIFGMLACPYFLYWLLYHPNYAASHDLSGHIGYIQHIAQDWTHPYAYMGRERWHPPTYYFLAAVVYRLGQSIGIDPLTAVRLLSMAMFGIFCLFAVATLRVVSTSPRSAPFFTSVMLLLFFPTSVLMASRINNDIALYAAWSASFFYLTRWYQRFSVADLRNTCIATGVAVAIKSNSIIVLGIVSAVVISALILRQISLRYFYSRTLMVGVGFLVLAGFVNLGRLLFGNGSAGDVALHFGQSGRDPSTIFHYLSFDLRGLVSFPFQSNLIEPGFWPYVARAMTFGEYRWRYPALASVLIFAVVVVLVSTVVITATRILAVRETWRRELPLLVSALFPFIALAAFYHLKGMKVCQDFRFIFPVIIPLCALYMRSLESVRPKPALRALYWILLMTGLIVASGSVLFYAGQYLYG